jgi:23S rRNA pseudouridine1911/1915/1917 synthase
MKKNSIDQDILYEDNHLIILNKQPSAIIQGDKTGDEPLSEALKQYLKIKYGKPGNVFVGVVHRLDRPVSGAVIFAKTSKALSRLNVMLRDGKIEKTYWAVTKNRPPDEAGQLISYLKRNEEKNKSFVHQKPVDGSQQAILNYRLAAASERYFLLEIRLLTGRHHQIRAQLASIGCPIKGDLKYGFPRSNPGGFIHLHARSVALVHPVKSEPLLVIADPPSDPVWDYFNQVMNSGKVVS